MRIGGLVLHYPIVVIGAGAGGLVVAIGAAKAGRRVLLIERGNWGGDCTNFGCIPSKSLIASSQAHSSDNPFRRLQSIVQEVRATEEPAALKEKGVDVAEGLASFIDPHTLDIEGIGRVRADQIVLATGSSPRIPAIDGLEQRGYLTNETLFSLDEVPKEMTVLGGGPIGCELGQALARLGCQVTLIQRAPRLIVREEPEASDLLLDRLRECGAKVRLGYEPASVEELGPAPILVAAGRTPTLDGLHLERAGITFSDRGVPTDRYGRTNLKHIWAIGDASGPPFFTHRAENHGRAVLTSLLLPGPLKRPISSQPMPRVTFTDPEIAGIGLLESEAIERWGAKKIATYTVAMGEVDRAIATGRREGFIKIITRKWSSKIVGASLVGPAAGELLPQIGMMIYRGIPLRKAAGLIYPYPTYSQGIRKAADRWLTQTVLR